jgi:hypothetical protein
MGCGELAKGRIRTRRERFARVDVYALRVQTCKGVDVWR